jgi:hypothetical protein
VIKVGSVDDVLSALSKSPKQVLQLTDFAIEFFRAKVVATDGGDEVDFEQFLGAKNKTAARFGFLAFVPCRSWGIGTRLVEKLRERRFVFSRRDTRRDTADTVPEGAGEAFREHSDTVVGWASRQPVIDLYPGPTSQRNAA